MSGASVAKGPLGSPLTLLPLAVPCTIATVCFHPNGRFLRRWYTSRILLRLHSINFRSCHLGIHRCLRRLQLMQFSSLIRFDRYLIWTHRAFGIDGRLSSLLMHGSKSLFTWSMRVLGFSACAMSTNNLGFLRLLRIRLSSS